MNKFFTYITLFCAVILTACSSDDFVEDNTPKLPENIIAMNENTASIQTILFDGQEDELMSKTSLSYNHFNSTMDFSWASGDQIGVFAVANSSNDGKHPVSAETSTQMKYQVEITNEKPLTVENGYITGIFGEVGDPISLTPNYEYASYSPCNSGVDKDYTRIPVSYHGQTQACNVEMQKLRAYELDKTNDEKKQAYMESEAAACAHLGNYDFMASTVQTTPAGHFHFLFQHMGATVRFFLLTPDETVIYDSLQLYSTYKEFPADAYLDIMEKELVTKKSSKSISLTFSGGINIPTNRANYMYTYSKPVIVAYMEVPAIDLTFADTSKKPTLYLCGHKDLDQTAYDALSDKDKAECTEITTGTYRMKRYFKANISQKNLRAGYYYQWNIAPGVDKPIEFQAISVQDWKDGTNFSNGEPGNGTGSW